MYIIYKTIWVYLVFDKDIIFIVTTIYDVPIKWLLS